MTDGQWIFERAMALMDAGDEVTGRQDVGATRPYKHRTLSILNILGRECARYDPGHGWRELEGLEEAVELDEELAQGVLPYGLAAHLLLEEDPAAASFFQQRYEELLERWRRRGSCAHEVIEPPYGGIEMGRFGRWGEWL